jgi:hypothetical protein
MILFNFVLRKVFLYTPSTLIEIIPMKVIATTSLLCEKHRCWLPSRAFQGLL